ncbi:MAG: DUF2834 domain-containing protein [Myxococcota bacterium]
MSALQLLYLALAIAGATGTWYFNLQMDDLSQFFALTWETPVSSSMAVDLLVVVAAFYVLMATEGRRLGIHPAILVILAVLTMVVALAFALPMFLFFRQRALDNA